MEYGDPEMVADNRLGGIALPGDNKTQEFYSVCCIHDHDRNTADCIHTGQGRAHALNPLFRMGIAAEQFYRRYLRFSQSRAASSVFLCQLFESDISFTFGWTNLA